MKQILPEEVQELIKLWNEREAYWVGEGYTGAQVYERLAWDSELPGNFDTKVIAGILDVQPDAMAQRRKRGDPPSFIRLAQNSVTYPRHAFCLWLRDRFVERRHLPAQQEYTAAT